MMRKNRSLAFHLVIAVAVKLVFLSALWWLFFHDTTGPLNADQVADNLSGKIFSKGGVK